MALNLTIPGQDNDELKPRITVFGVGGAGGNAVNNMIDKALQGVEFVVANTDAQALAQSRADTRIQMGVKATEGLGAGARPAIGAAAAEETIEEIVDRLAGAHMCFITAGMGGGTGTGAAPVVADVARELGILTVAVVTRPFQFEGRKRMAVASEGINLLKERVDSLITVPNERLLSVLGKSTSLLEAFKAANDVLLGAVQGIADLIIRPGMINVDFADVRTVMSEMGMAMMGSGEARGESRACEAAEAAVHSPLLEDIDLRGAKGILVNITAGPDLSLGEFADVGDTVEQFASENATVVVGTVIDPDLDDQLRVTVVATGLGQPESAIRPAAPTKVVDNTVKPGGEIDFTVLDRPTVTRRPAARSNAAVKQSAEVQQAELAMEPVREPASRSNVKPDVDLDYLDIPAFLRRQAD